MPVKTTLLLTCAAVALTVAVRTEAGYASVGNDAAPALIFEDARPAEPKPLRAAVPTRVAPTSALAVAPFVLDAPKPAAPAEATAPRKDAIDLDALRYFAAQNDLGRVSAEIRLIRSKHPDWEPPQDLFSEVGSGIDEQPLWDLLARRDFAALRAKMDDIRRDKPEWQPTSDLANKIALGEARATVTAASDGHRWTDVIATASTNPSLLTCDDVDALWRTAEALVRTGDEARAVAAYRYVLTTCAAADIRLATVQKASLLLTAPGGLDGLIALGRRSADGRGEFDQVRLDLMRKTIGAATAGTVPTQPTPDEIAAVTASAASPGGRADAALLGWYARSRKDYDGAIRWFRAALATGPDAKAAEGLVLALRDAGQMPETTRLAFQYADLGPLNRKLMVEVAALAMSDPKATPLTRDEVSAAMAATDTLKSSDGAQALGWYSYKGGDVAKAESWFRKSADWQANESAAIGLVVSAHRLRHDRDYAARIEQYRATYPRIAELESLMRPRQASHPAARVAVQAHRGSGKRVVVARASARQAAPKGDGWDRSADDIVKVYNAGQYDQAVALLEQRRQKRAEPRGLTVVRGWAMYNKGDWEGAKQVFSGLDAGSYSQERMEGLRVIQQAYTPPHLR